MHRSYLVKGDETVHEPLLPLRRFRRRDNGDGQRVPGEIGVEDVLAALDQAVSHLCLPEAVDVVRVGLERVNLSRLQRGERTGAEEESAIVAATASGSFNDGV